MNNSFRLNLGRFVFGVMSLVFCVQNSIFTNKMKRPSHSVCFHHVSAWPGHATIQPRGQQRRQRLHILLVLSF